MYCEKCGKFLENDDRFCSSCGKQNPDYPAQSTETAQQNYQNGQPEINPGYQGYQTAQPYQNNINYQTAQPEAEVGFTENNSPVYKGPDIDRTARRIGLKVAVLVCGMAALGAAAIGGIISIGSHDEISPDRDIDVDPPSYSYDYNGECYFNPANKIDEQVLWETENVKITAKQFTHDGEYDSYADLELLIENKTDKEFTLMESNTSVNEYMVNPSLYAVIPAGKTLSDSLAFEVDELEELGIDNINEIQTSFILKDKEYEEIDRSDNIVMQTRNSEKDELIEGVGIYDSEGIKIEYFGIDKDEDDYSIKVLVTNNTDTDMDFSAENVSVNDCVIDYVFSYPGLSVSAGKRQLSRICINNEKLEKYDIDVSDIKKIEFSLEGTLFESYEKVFDSGKVTITK